MRIIYNKSHISVKWLRLWLWISIRFVSKLTPYLHFTSSLLASCSLSLTPSNKQTNKQTHGATSTAEKLHSTYLLFTTSYIIKHANWHLDISERNCWIMSWSCTEVNVRSGRCNAGGRLNSPFGPYFSTLVLTCSGVSPLFSFTSKCFKTSDVDLVWAFSISLLVEGDDFLRTAEMHVVLGGWVCKKILLLFWNISIEIKTGFPPRSVRDRQVEVGQLWLPPAPSVSRSLSNRPPPLYSSTLLLLLLHSPPFLSSLRASALHLAGRCASVPVPPLSLCLSVCVERMCLKPHTSILQY